MKKILLASTILVGSAGIAAADVTFTGEAYVGMAYAFSMDETIAPMDWDQDGFTTSNVGYLSPEVTASFTAGMMTTTDMGLEAGASITVDAGGVSIEDDHTEATFGESATSAFAVSDANAYLSGDWGMVEVEYDANGAGAATYDVTATYSHSFSNFDLSAYYTMSPGVTDGDLGADVAYNFGDYSVYGEFDWDASAEAGTGDWRVGFGGAATFSGFTLGVDVDYTPVDTAAAIPADWDWAANASYTTGAITVGAFIEDDGADDRFDFGANASYDMGGGVSIDAAYIFDRDYDTAGANDGVSLVKLGVSMAF